MSAKLALDLGDAPSALDFDPADWQDLCRARRRGDSAEWYRLMRRLCAYTTGRHMLDKQMRAAVDAYLGETVVQRRGRP